MHAGPTPVAARAGLSLPGRSVARLALAVHALAVVAALLLAGCAAPPTIAPVAPLPPAQAQARVTLIGAQGAEGDRLKSRDLAQVAAEGRGGLLQRQLGVLAAQGEQNLYRGNSARLLVDGPQTFAAMKAAIAAARHRVLLESYIVEDEGVAAEFADLLRAKAAEGVSVALLYDSVGSWGTDRAFFARLRDGGVAVCAFNPVTPFERPGHWGWWQRDHRKMLAVDSDVAFTGGINLSNVYERGSFGGPRRGSGPRLHDDHGSTDSDSDPGEGWRDTQVELRGPVVTAMAVVFRESWLSQGCPGTLPPGPPPSQPAPGERVVKLAAAEPQHGANPTYAALLAAVQAAQRSVHLTVGYFAPGDDMVRALGDAAQRGVDVTLMLPGRSDVRWVLYAARSHYAQLLAAGVNIHEMQHAVMHAKTAVIDGVFASVGSSNLDWRSIVGNNEIDVIVLGDDFGQALDELFARDLARSTRIDPDQWARRGAGRKLLENLGRLIEPML